MNGVRRIALRDIDAFIAGATATSGGGAVLGGEASQWTIRLQPSQDFDVAWPDGTLERYEEACEGTATGGFHQLRVRLGFCDRHAAGMLRRRAVVLVNERPLVLFVGANDFVHSRQMASLLKGRDDKVIQVVEGIPREYRDFRVAPYRSIVNGPYASRGLAVLTSADDHATMVRHALNRAAQKGLLD